MLKDYITEQDGQYVFEYNVADKHLQVNGRSIKSITLQVCVDGSEYYSGDLAVNWAAVDDSDYDDGCSTLIMRNIHDDNVNTETMGAFYWDHAFDDTLHSLLVEAGFSTSAAHNVYGSEWGMQDVGRASYDAFECCAEICAAYDVDVKQLDNY